MYLSPVAKYPGPLLAKFSSLWIVIQCRYGRRSEAVYKQHEKYGDFVRIAPNHISIANPAAVQEIYGFNSGFIKGPFYEDKWRSWSTRNKNWLFSVNLPFFQVEPVVFNTRDVRIHQRKRKILNPAFSPKNLQDFEPHMSINIQKLTACVMRRLQCSEWAELDFNRYGRC